MSISRELLTFAPNLGVNPMKRILSVLMLCAAFTACAGASSKKTASKDAADSLPARTIRIPDAPRFLETQQEQVAYVAEHYWDLFDFADTTYIDSVQTIEKPFGKYAQLLTMVPPTVAEAAQKRTMHAAEKSKKMFDFFADLSEKYFFNPNSPVRNENAYIATLEILTTTPLYDQWERIRPEAQLSLALKNRPGYPANDFTYTLKSGAKGTLYGIKSRYTLLFIGNPGCPACEETRQQVCASEMITKLVADGFITVLAVYPDEDLSEWRQDQNKVPAKWINSYDKSLKLRNDELYDLKAIPTLYLLDENKIVLLKDCLSVPTIEQTIYYRENAINQAQQQAQQQPQK